MAETSIVYDYEQNEVRIWTDRSGVARQILKRSQGKAKVTESKQVDRIIAWSISLPLECCRGAYAIAKVLASESEMPFEDALESASEESPVHSDVQEVTNAA
ncbi:hypothetical protein ACQ4M3_05170 [Leptolyngbya sp. AN03gr2]|uniref:hypothetical protein n=1 Tax=unclassified Leptolyngbya TaxID=2650499 RepID=UPI003D316763